MWNQNWDHTNFPAILMQERGLAYEYIPFFFEKLGKSFTGVKVTLSAAIGLKKEVSIIPLEAFDIQGNRTFIDSRISQKNIITPHSDILKSNVQDVAILKIPPGSTAFLTNSMEKKLEEKRNAEFRTIMFSKLETLLMKHGAINLSQP